MVVLKNFNGFGATHWETGSLSHALAYQGTAISEAMMLGISGGIVVGYFTFAYEGHDPHVALLSRNTFDPFERMCERLGIVQEIRQTPNVDKAAKNLVDALEDGKPVITLVDVVTLPYNGFALDEGMWVMMPVLVYGVESGEVLVSDRANVGLKVDAETFAAARNRTKANKNKMLTLDLENLDKLPRAVEKGINDCISLFIEAPPKGAKHNFGFAALDYWADALVKDKAKQGWVNVFPAGRALYNGLVTAFSGIEIFGTGGSASRPLYADFLDESATLLNRPGLSEAATLFRQSGAVWSQLGCALLPDEIAPLKETRELMLKRQQLFRDKGNSAIEEMNAINTRLDAIRKASNDLFSSHDERRLREQIREAVLAVRDTEREAVNALESAMT